MRVIANSLPKSGTHLLTRLLELLGLQEKKPNLDASMVRLRSKNPIRRAVKKRRLWREGMSGSGLMVDIDNPDNRVHSDWLWKKVEGIQENCFVKAHLPYSEDLEAMLLSFNYKLLFIIRDPRDVALSYCNHMLRDPKQSLHKLFSNLSTYEDRIRVVIEGYKGDDASLLAPLQDRIQNALGWWRSSKICSVRFEDLIGPKGGGSEDSQHKEIDKICAYLDVALSIEKRNNIAEKLFYPKASTFYKGVIGQWRNIFRPDTIKIFKENCSKSLVDLQYEKDRTC